MINASIVLYHTPAAEVQKIVRLLRACPEINEIWLIDNSEIMTEAFMFLPATYILRQSPQHSSPKITQNQRQIPHRTQFRHRILAQRHNSINQIDGRKSQYRTLYATRAIP